MNLEAITNLLSDFNENGAANVGLAAGTDTILAIDKKLPVLRRSGIITVSEYIKAALTNMTAYQVNNPVIKKLTVASVYAVFSYDLVRLDILDMDCKSVTSFGSASCDVDINGSDIKDALNLIVATKVHFYLTNHHTGQGSLTGYPAKLVKAKYPGEDISAFTDLLHMIGHWANNQLTFKAMGMLQDTDAIGTGQGFKIIVGADVTMRMSGMPSGTAKLGLCHTLMMRIIGSPLFDFMPYVEDLLRVKNTYLSIMENRFMYHISAKAITGKERLPYDDNNFDRPLAILATFSMKTNLNSSINKSPLIAGPTSERYKDIDGYSPDFERVCAAYMRASKVKDEAAVEQFNTQLGDKRNAKAIAVRREIEAITASRKNANKVDDILDEFNLSEEEYEESVVTQSEPPVKKQRKAKASGIGTAAAKKAKNKKDQ